MSTAAAPSAICDDDAAAAVSQIESEEHTAFKKELRIDLVTGEQELDENGNPIVDTVVVKTYTRKVRRFDKNPALNTLAKHFKLVGDEGDGVNALASALADRLQSARKRALPLVLENDDESK